MVDRSTKLILILIAAGLWLNGIMPFLHPKNVKAARDSFECDGKLQANAWGGIKETIGGYNVELSCK